MRHWINQLTTDTPLDYSINQRPDTLLDQSINYWYATGLINQSTTWYATGSINPRQAVANLINTTQQEPSPGSRNPHAIWKVYNLPQAAPPPFPQHPHTHTNTHTHTHTHSHTDTLWNVNVCVQLYISQLWRRCTARVHALNAHVYFIHTVICVYVFIYVYAHVYFIHIYFIHAHVCISFKQLKSVHRHAWSIII
jgi:hypothetical protein